MNQPRTLDEARASHPALTFFLSAGAGMPVSLDIVDEAEGTYSIQAPTEAEAWALAFPATETEPVDPPVWSPTEQMQREAAAANPADTGIPTAIGLFD